MKPQRLSPLHASRVCRKRAALTTPMAGLASQAREASSTAPRPPPEPTFSSNYDAEQGKRELEPLLTRREGSWVLVQSGRGVERSFKFKTFGRTWDFMNAVAAQCKIEKHHPEWANVYNTAFIRWTTHSPAGLSEKDVRMARFCDEQASIWGEVEGGDDAVGRELAERVASEGGDCCVPKKKG